MRTGARVRRLHLSGRAPTWGFVLVLVVAAVWLRVRGIAFGLPAVYNPDEVAIMSRALAFAKGDLNPHNFLYPTVYFYALFAWIGGFFGVARLAGLYKSALEFQQSFFLDPTSIYLAGRALSVACGAGVVVATWKLGARLIGTPAGLAAAGFMAVAPFAVRDAHYVKHDVPATLAVVLALWAVARLVDDRVLGAGEPMHRYAHAPAQPTGGLPRRPALDLTIAGLAVGLAASVHYYLVFAALPLGLAAWWSEADAPKRLRALAVAAVAAAAGFFAGSPFLVAEPGTALADISANRRIVMDRALDAGGAWFPSAPAYARMLWADAAGWPVTALALLGLAVTARRKPRVALLLAAFPIAFLAFISNTVAATRYLNPALPFLAIFAGAGVAWLGGRTRRPAATALCAAGVASIPAILASVGLGSFFREADTRALALEYFVRDVPAGSTVLLQPYSVPLAQSREGLVEALRAHLGEERRASTKFQMQLALPRWPSPSYRVIWLGSGGLDVDKVYVDPAAVGGAAGLEPLRRLGVQYVVLKGYNGVSPAAQPLEAALAREARRVAVFSPYRAAAARAEHIAPEPFLHNTDARIVPALERPGPEIYIWKL